MTILRKSALGLVVTLFFTTALLFGLGWGLLQVVGQPQPIKDALARSGIYQSIIDEQLQQVNQRSAELPLDRPEVQDLIKTAAPPELLQTKAENAVDSIYAWIHGDAPDLKFELEVSDIRANLADGVEQYVATRAASLPICPPGTGAEIASDPYNAACRPEVVTASQVAAQAKAEFLASDALRDSTINASTIQTESGKTLAQEIENAPSIYERIAQAVFGSGVLALLLVGGVVLLSATWRVGVKRVAIIAIVLGSLTIIASLVAGAGVQYALGLVEEPTGKSGITFVEILAGDLRAWWLWYGAALIGAGIAALVALRFIKPRPTGSTELDPRSQTGVEEQDATPTQAHTSERGTEEDSGQHKPPQRLVQ